jgi:hypothetical protein
VIKLKFIVLLLVGLLVGLFVSSVAFGEATSGAEYGNCYLNRFLDHDHQYTLEKPRPELELGVITEVILYKDDLLSVPYSIGTQGQYVWETGDWGLYGKVTVDLSGKIKDLIGR